MTDFSRFLVPVAAPLFGKPGMDTITDDVDALAKRRPFQFSLRGLMLAMLLGGLLLGWYGIRQYEVMRERAVLVELQDHGVHVQFHQGRVVGLSVSGPGLENATLARLDRLPRLQRLVFIDTPLDDSGMKNVAQLTDLEQLLLLDAEITDRGLAHIEEMHNLRTLRLDHTRVTEAGLRHVARLPKLERLDLAGVNLGEAGLKALAQMPRLKQLYLTETGVTESEVQWLQERQKETKIMY